MLRFDINYQTKNRAVLGLEITTAEFNSSVIFPFLNLLQSFVSFFYIFGTSLQIMYEIMINVISKCECNSSVNKVEKSRADNKFQ